LKHIFKKLTSVWLLILLTQNIYSQVVANFSQSVEQGCAPLHVDFTNLSSGNNISYSWNLGNGNNSTQENPSANYSTPGTYTITLQVTNGTETSQISKTLEVMPSPIANFTCDRINACTFDQIQFTDASTSAGVSIVDWIWDFRNGSFPPHNSNVSNSYSSAGTYGVSLEIIDANGCHAFVERLDYINIVQPPIVSYTSSVLNACEIPVTSNFVATIANNTNPPYTYVWNLGNSSTQPNSPNVSTTYTSFGIYNVNLQVTDASGCSSTAHYPDVNIFEISAVILAIGPDTNLFNGDTICPNTVIDFSDSTLSSGAKYWYLNGTIANSGTSYIFEAENSGPKELVLKVVGGGACIAFDTISFFVDNIVAGFTPDYDTVCSTSQTFEFTDASQNANEWIYDWNDGDSSFVPNPSHVFNISTSLNTYTGHEHTYFQYVKSPFGCEDSEAKSTFFKPPFAEFIYNLRHGFAPVDVDFTNKSKPLPDLVSYEWFDNGVPFSTNSDPTYTLTEPGLHDIVLVVTNSEGCTDTSIIRSIMVADLDSVADFLVDSCIGFNPIVIGSMPEICAQDSFGLAFAQTHDDFMYEYNGDGLSHMCSGRSQGSFAISGQVGITEVTGSIWCYGHEFSFLPININIKGPYAHFDYLYDCDAPFDIQFSSQILDATSFMWDFGDGTLDSLNISPSHHYSIEDTFSVSLRAYNDTNGCQYFYSADVIINPPFASLTAPDTVCAGNFSIDISGCRNAYSTLGKPFFWFIDSVPFGYTDTTSTLPIGYGQHEIALVIRNQNFCYDTARVNTLAIKPTASFTNTTPSGCVPLTVDFTNTSSSQLPIDSVVWIIANDTIIDQNQVSHSFNSGGQYDAHLTVFDSFGCSDNIIKYNYINVVSPNSTISVSDNSICAGTDVTISVNTTQFDSIVWHIDTLNFTTYDTTQITYHFDEWGLYQPSVVVWYYTCGDHQTLNSYIRVQERNADYSVSDTISECYPSEIVFDFAGLHPSEVISWSWDFGMPEALSFFSDSVRFNYMSPGIYHTSLRTATSYGCIDTSYLTIEVKGPVGHLEFSDDYICKGDSINFFVTDTSSVNYFYLDYGDGNGSEALNTSHSYAIGGIIHPNLILYSDSSDINGCRVVVDTIIHVSDVQADFSAHEISMGFDTLIACNPYNGQIINNSQNSGYNFWYIDDILISQSVDLSYLFVNNSAYVVKEFEVKLYIEDIAHVCHDSIIKTITVKPSPDINLINDSVICYGDTVLLYPSGNHQSTISWVPLELNNEPDLWNITLTPTQETLYKATVNLNGCENSDSVLIKIQNNYNVNWSQDTTIIIGQSAEMYAIPDQIGIVPIWTPDTGLSCNNCFNPIASPLETTIYTFTVSDTMGCYSVSQNIIITVDEKYSVNLPSSFTPNNDGANDIVYVRGWGIQELLEFKIFNRWGESIFYTSDINQGWDGTYRGSVQNIDSYVYYVKVKMYSGQEIEKRGTITLLK